MPKIPNLLAFGKHCHNCGKWMQRRALRKDVACNFCLVQLCSRCVECDNIILDNCNYCESCGLETNRQMFYQTKQLLRFLKIAIVTHQSKEKD